MIWVSNLNELLGIHFKYSIFNLIARVVGWTNEENGGRGGRAYAQAHGNETVFAIESDGGSSTPTGNENNGDRNELN